MRLFRGRRGNVIFSATLEALTSAETRGPRRRLAPAFVGLAFAGMAAQLYAKIDRYAVNIFFSHQWATADYLIKDYGVWRSFAAQYGPPGFGVGALLSGAVAREGDGCGRKD